MVGRTLLVASTFWGLTTCGQHLPGSLAADGEANAQQIASAAPEVAAAVDRLESAVPETRAAAACALRAMSERANAAIPALIERLDDDAVGVNSDRQQRVVGLLAGDALWAIGGPAVEPLMAAALHHPRVKLRCRSRIERL